MSINASIRQEVTLPPEIDDATRAVLLAYLEPMEVGAGTVILRQGQPNDRLWFLSRGTAEIERTWHGKTLSVANLSAPGIFGATTFFRPASTNVTIRATSDASLLSLSHEAHDRLSRENPRVAAALALATVRVLAERFDLIDQRMTEFVNARNEAPGASKEWARFRARLFEEPNII
jgi:CRP-like cAMP-binding protein